MGYKIGIYDGNPLHEQGFNGKHPSSVWACQHGPEHAYALFDQKQSKTYVFWRLELEERTHSEPKIWSLKDAFPFTKG